MLTHTFQHIPGINAIFEKYLWKIGVMSWDDLLSLKKLPLVSIFLQDRIRRCLISSQEALIQEDLNFFVQRLPQNLYWRLLPAFQEKVVYFDIEATGLDLNEDLITVIGIYDGSSARSYYRSCNLNEAKEVLQATSFWVTFNGDHFDIPFLNYAFQLKASELHVDLRKVYCRLGVSGMLKTLEKMVECEREIPLRYLGGATAVMLWREFQSGNMDALRLLLRYNLEDTVNLENLFIHAFNMNLEKTPFIEEKMLFNTKPDLDEGWNKELAWEIANSAKKVRNL